MDHKGGAGMPNIKSAKKRVIVNQTKAQRNRSANTALKTAIKKAVVAIDTNAADKAEVVTICHNSQHIIRRSISIYT